MKHYEERNVVELDEIGNHYSNHVSAMTSEGLYSKSDIAAELGYRDAMIDSLKSKLQSAEQERDQLKAQVNGMKQAIDDLVRDSEGVAGLHQNGDVAPWDELLTGGRFDEWLCVLDDTPQQSLATHDAEVIERFCDYAQTKYRFGLHSIAKDYADQLRQQVKEVQS